ncbi:MAG: nickel ABC transporter substrate-binding protein [Caldilineaceae bacterium]
MKNKQVYWFSVLMLVAVLLAGCIAAPTGGGAPTTNEANVEQTFIVASTRDVGELNPHNYGSSFPALDMVYEPLVRYAADGTLQPGLAESWTHSEDGLTWSFKLRQGVTFHDGTPFNAAAAKWNLERWVGNEDHNWLPTTNLIDSIETPDEYTLVLHTKEFYYALVQELALVRPVRFLSPNGVDATGAFVKAIGTGPWQLQEYVKDQRAVFVPYPNYWGTKPKLDKVVFDVIPDPQTRVAALLSGEVHLIGGENLGSIPLESVLALRNNADVALLTGEGSTSFVMHMNYQRAPFNDPKVRAAINHAINREGIAKQVFSGLASPATGLFPATIPYAGSPLPETYTFDLEKAKSLLAEAGWTPGSDGLVSKDGKPLQVRLVADSEAFPQVKSMAEVVQANLQAIGIGVEIRLFEYEAWRAAIAADEFELDILLTWGAPYDPHSSLTAFFKTGYTTSAGQMFNSPELDKILTAISSEKDDTARQAAYDAFWRNLDENAAVAPLVYSQRIYALRKNVSGFELAGTEYELALQNVTISAP